MNKLVAFLGNPGSQFKLTRHNTAWLLCDSLQKEGLVPDKWQEKFHGLYCKVGDTVYLKPQTYMNLSGQSVQEAAKFYSIKPQDILVVHDDIELKFGEFKKQLGGGMGGHNGLRSIKQSLGTEQFMRLRIGIGRPEDNHSQMDVATWVTARFTELEEKLLQDMFKNIAHVI